VFIDESAFYLLPMAVRTYAPRGHTPVLRVFKTRDHLSAISAITPAGKLYLQVRKDAYDSAGVIGFLRQLLRQIPGPLLVIWDKAPIHHSQEIKQFLTTKTAKRLHLEMLPSYAPDLDPDEGIWSYLKGVELKNVCAPNLAVLEGQLRRAARRLRRKPAVIRACFQEAGLLL
jgi:transposase